EAGIAGSEVIERKPAMQRLEFLRHDLGARQIIDQRAFGDLNRQPIKRKSTFLSSGCNALRKFEIHELKGGDVDRQSQGAVDEHRACKSHVQDGLRELVDQPDLLNGGDEVIGQDGAEAGMIPPGEDLKPGQLAGAQFDQGLEEWNDLVALEGSE